MSQDMMDLEKLQQRVLWSTVIAFLIFVLVIAAYIIKLWLIQGGTLAASPDVWGQFGDYIGGLLNPLVAFLAFYWLTQSVLLQKEELSATRGALIDSAQSQRDQVENAARTARINALSALLSSHNSDLSRLHGEAEYLGQQLRMNFKSGESIILLNGKLVAYRDAMDEAKELNDRLGEVFHDRQSVMFRIDAELDTGFYAPFSGRTEQGELYFNLLLRDGTLNQCAL